SSPLRGTTQLLLINLEQIRPQKLTPHLHYGSSHTLEQDPKMATRKPGPPSSNPHLRLQITNIRETVHSQIRDGSSNQKLHTTVLLIEILEHRSAKGETNTHLSHRSDAPLLRR
ncbi:hypothetical protein KC19_11G113300, partial [Ceratodon purpureus]